MGYDLSKQLDSPFKRYFVFMQISESQVGRAIRTDKYKYSVRALKDGNICHDSSVYFEDYLYDLENDPYEKTNLVRDKKYTKVRARLRSLLKHEMRRAGERECVILPAPYTKKI